MQLCSLHHCVLFFLIFTFTTLPVSALEICPKRVKLQQPVTLSCTHRCSGLLQWNLLSDRGVVLARCDQKSCWAEKGFNISHDKYLKGDLSLTITEADYSKRNLYACECGDSDYALVRLVIETVLTPVQMKPDEALKLKVSVPEPVEVIYKSGDSADEVICNVTKDSLQCKDEYRHRTSLTYPELTLRDMKPRDSGSYTIRDTKNNEDIQIYTVSVEEKPGFPAWGAVLITILLCCCVGAGIFLLYKGRMRKQLERRLQLVDQLVQEAVGGTEEQIREVEKSLDQLQQQYNKTEYKDKVKVFCSEKRRQMLECRLQQVDQLVQEAEGGTEKISRVEKSLDQLQQQYNKTEYKDTVNVFCSDKRRRLLNIQLLPVVQLLQQNKEWEKEDTERVERELKLLKDLYRNTKYIHVVSLLCLEQRSQMNWYRLQYSKEESLMTKRRKLNRKLLHVEQLVQQAKEGTEEKITEAEKAIDEVELQYSDTEYSAQVLMLCEVKRNQLNPLYSNKGLITPEKELNIQVHHVEQLVQQAERGTEEKISEARKVVGRLELKYYNSEYSADITFFCMTKRAELFWYRLLHSDILRMTE